MSQLRLVALSGMRFVVGLRRNPIPPIHMASKISRIDRAVTKTIQVPPENKALATCFHETRCKVSHLSSYHRFGTTHWQQLTGRNPSVLVLDIWRQCDGCTSCPQHTPLAQIHTLHRSAQRITSQAETAQALSSNKTYLSCKESPSQLQWWMYTLLAWSVSIFTSRIQTDCEHLKEHGKLPMARQWSCLGALFASNKVRTAMRQSSYLFWKQELWWKLSSRDVGLFMRTVGPFLDPFLDPCLFCMTCCGKLLQAWAMQEADCTRACLRLENSPSLSFSIVLKKAYQAVPILAHT